MTVAERIASFFVAGAPPRPAVAATPPSAVGSAVVLGAPAAGASLALALARTHRAPVAVLLAWTPAPTTQGSPPCPPAGPDDPGSPPRPAAGPGGPDSAPRLPSSPTARRLARSLVARDVPADASLRLVRGRLPAGDADAEAAVRRATAAVPAMVPVVIVLDGPRGAALDGLLAAVDLVAVSGATDDAATTLACAGAEASAVGVPVVAVPPPSGAAARLAPLGLSLRGTPLPVPAGTAA
jgi:hypothetical protein